MNKLTIEEKNKRIAKYLGWEFCERARIHHGKPNPWTIPHCRHPEYFRGRWTRVANLPGYFTDLNAIHKAEKNIGDADFHLKENGNYGEILYQVVGEPKARNWLSATAAQRAEALGQTLNLWQSGE